MTDSPKLASPSSDRAARLREALRENLKRRKTQLRGRAALAEAEGEGESAGAEGALAAPNGDSHR